MSGSSILDARARSASGGLVAYFGYGSLVCRATHRTEIVHAVPARLKGWRRYWRPRPDMPGFPAALLTVREEAGAGCDGLLVFDRAENLAAIDAREARYRRVAIEPGALELRNQWPADCPIWVYVAQEELPVHPEPPTILQSYLDAVMLGFLEEHGEEGLDRFLTETRLFDLPIHADRRAPIYPRAVPLQAELAERFDVLLTARRGFRFAEGHAAG
jgi:cation transport regulator ChaC